jgi:hypothetical protein
VVQLDLLHGAAPVVGAVVHVDALPALVQQFDGRQDPVAVQAIGVQVIRTEIRRGDKAHAVVEHGGQQPVQDHGVGDVGHMKLIKAHQPVAFGHALAKLVQRVHRALQSASSRCTSRMNS